MRPTQPLEEVQQPLNRILASREFDRFAAIGRPALALSVADAGETIDVHEWRACGAWPAASLTARRDPNPAG
jgi:hypothetical protein